ncbi:bifunctional diaminohydroxyphosphoribosylaminopyrimidine deaminase/5-amino-6-(5-phosphoribosylamino)uracil reductase RibD [Spirochaeta isovalerica]|uniref:Riboflavin biosynthesis protein RibD n=1 Tax=Spirochaeta isovalerica TaxID=150 RepID=A0A841R6Y2_9SPIO|nr:bifunctional diaminohydroxyphosphoribosylaminopyrimidine deaminase/5-amino-6-(5-phosphoribosylamino)uracil reductase RibD [Spirochaeta isovalerica]MBB6478528.1 diaminohydroxyphosphoribosylaminopyrimidine deaminase/5-amino-6-(5-phosphoribosylamino)uracil reductase [Spirochaeta isovalerica]
MNHQNFMTRALELASLAIGSVSPNPAVGAVLVKNGRIIGEGCHRGPGSLHAEIDAIENASESVSGATLFCTLEPCCTVYPGKRQPPCTDRIIAEKIREVVIAANDPNPHVNGMGVARLKSRGITVREGLLKDEAEKLNEVFNVNQKEQRAFVHLKIAQTLDGRIATSGGDSKWITDEDARRDVHRYRSLYDSVLVGAGTVRADNPKLNSRLIDMGKNPIRIVLSRSLDFPQEREIFSDDDRTRTIVVTSPDSRKKKKLYFTEKGIEVLEFTDLPHLLQRLYRKGICSVFVEGGKAVYTSFLQQQAYDRLSIYTAPLICGTGIDAVGNLQTGLMNQSLRFGKTEFEMINNQTVFHGWRF